MDKEAVWKEGLQNVLEKMEDVQSGILKLDDKNVAGISEAIILQRLDEKINATDDGHDGTKVVCSTEGIVFAFEIWFYNYCFCECYK